MKKLFTFASLILATGFSTLAQANQDFDTCVVGLKQKAKDAGISAKTIDETLGQVSYVTRVIELDKKQPEFSQSFDNYFSKRVTDWRVEEGRRLLKQHRQLLTKLQQQYGVPPQYLMAFWGLETNFGSYKGKMPVIDSLATLACDPRRSSYFTGELLQAMKLKQNYQFSTSDMVGSWAGAMGHTQFMPSAYAKYAIDGDGDGKADLWNSTEDALSSAANFLQQLGWVKNERWGREVKLPAQFEFKSLGRNSTQPLVNWAELGIIKANGQKLSTPDMTAALYLPAGHTGPAFLGYENFNVIMRWNRSEFYAIAVGHLADRINGAAPLMVAPPQQDNFSRDKIKLLQSKLNEQGFDVGKPDGVLGTNSRTGLQAYQRSVGIVADGFPSEETFKRIGIE
ncbi:lytic murein transglycosylase [Shewanella sp. Isolate11]|uniref:lytic murein transglycosylase n=1 Tax=Shewanella sp. Isolate11 TaxID=2908530 RepID=UPI001EFCDA4F|nr:lytic murein transglycosylase [Shewanella sp. Isolate11]MCG9696797.1 lytic murein transglycosylase [Shewanella sp. Isolate11]